jgi:hypothetical protein
MRAGGTFQVLEVSMAAGVSAEKNEPVSLPRAGSPGAP